MNRPYRPLYLPYQIVLVVFLELMAMFNIYRCRLYSFFFTKQVKYVKMELLQFSLQLQCTSCFRNKSFFNYGENSKNFQRHIILENGQLTSAVFYNFWDIRGKGTNRENKSFCGLIFLTSQIIVQYRCAQKEINLEIKQIVR